jgi:hypothetical protein
MPRLKAAAPRTLAYTETLELALTLDTLVLSKTVILFDIPAEIAGEQREGRTWTIKQELGHLVDSAMNNHNRIMRAALDGHYTGPTYDPDAWVALADYTEIPWTTLVSFWRDLNLQLSRIIARIPPDRLTAPCTVGSDAPVTLQFLIDDYSAHMLHHLDQIFTQ